MSTIEIRDILNKAFMNLSPNEMFGPVREKNGCVDLRIRIDLHEFDQYPLCPTPMSDPVSDESDFFLNSRHSAQYRER